MMTNTQRVLLALTLLLPLAHADAQTIPPQVRSAQANNSPIPAADAKPNTAPSAPIAPTYIVSPGDSIDLVFRWTPEFNQTVTVQPDGRASITAVGGEIKLAGLTLREIHDEIVARSSEKLINPELVISPHDIERPRVLVGGEVNNPGKIELRQATTAFEAIFLAGGAKESSRMSHVVVFRRVNGEFSQVYNLNFANYDNGKKPANDMLLQPGDMVLVPRDGIAKFGRYVRTLNLGAYFSFNPLGTNGFF